MPAARVSDMHTCPMVTPGTPPVPHVGGPIIPPCEPTVIVGGMPQARVGDMCICVGPLDTIVKGSPTVLVGGKPAARIGDLTSHGGVIVTGMPTVLIGDFAAVGAMILDGIANAVNPENSVVNCGHIIDAVVARLTGTDPDAVAPAGGDGSFTDIEGRMNTTMTWGSDFQSAFDAVEAGGHGTMAVVGIGYSGGTASHVVILANQNGTVGIVEGQNWGPGNEAGVIDNVADANARYNGDGGSNIGWGIVGANGP